ncbi:hypothetical protein ACMD2_07652 [Ananas comosus]|uniref:Uncharacterized protein n=1 Tax=Ananas comosus TaxID=4615 RepID=A0A199VS33_ANACO|nr:hypothetical protein ACMD2_07652 [Ananas comosus]
MASSDREPSSSSSPPPPSAAIVPAESEAISASSSAARPPPQAHHRRRRSRLESALEWRDRGEPRRRRRLLARALGVHQGLAETLVLLRSREDLGWIGSNPGLRFYFFPRRNSTNANPIRPKQFNLSRQRSMRRGGLGVVAPQSMGA